MHGWVETTRVNVAVFRAASLRFLLGKSILASWRASQLNRCAVTYTSCECSNIGIHCTMVHNIEERSVWQLPP